MKNSTGKHRKNTTSNLYGDVCRKLLKTEKNNCLLKSEGSTQLASMLGLDIAPNGFIRVGDPHTGTNRTNRPGIFIAGCSSSPMNLTDTLTDARSAAITIGEYLKNNENKH